MADETKEKIAQATYKLIVERGYTRTTTKDIAKLAGVSEVTIFRKFQGKQEILEYILQQVLDIPELNLNILNQCVWDLKVDLKMFSKMYFKYVTPDYMKLIIGTREPELSTKIKEQALAIPKSFKTLLIQYFTLMHEKGKLNSSNFELLTMMYFSINFGFIFLKVSFGKEIVGLTDEVYIEQSIETFVQGL